MKKLIFTKKFPHNEVLVYTPKFEMLGKLKYSTQIKVWKFEPCNDKYLTIKRMEDILEYMKKNLKYTGRIKNNGKGE